MQVQKKSCTAHGVGRAVTADGGSDCGGGKKVARNTGLE